MSAEVLRRAAALMRERARRAEALRFWPADDHDGMDETYSWSELVSDLPGDDALNLFVESWHPTVAMLGADAMEQHSHLHDSYDCVHEPCAHEAWARAYLNEDPP